MNARQKTETVDPASVDFINTISVISPNLDAPVWLAEVADAIRRSFLAAAGLGPPVRAVVSCPPQVGKTSVILHGIAIWLKHRPQDSLIYCTYNNALAREKSLLARDLAQLCGIELREDSRSLETWTTKEGGGLRARALVGGAINGTPDLKWIVIDDPHKNRRDAESAASRRDVQNAFKSSIVQRLHPTTSVLVVHTRYHEQDLIGSLIKEHPDVWQYINIPAVDEHGIATCPQRLPQELAEEKRRLSGEYEWWSVYMGQPRPREGKLFPFESAQRYTALPDTLRVAIGVDLAYSSKTSADWSVAVAMGEHAGYWYVLDVLRRQVSIEAFASELRAFYQRHMGPVRSFIGRNEAKNLELLRARGIPIQGADAQSVGDKYVRSQGFSAAWKAGKVLLPQPSLANQEWLEPFIDCVTEFTGINDDHDDDVDAAVSAFDALPASSSSQVLLPKPPTINRPGPSREPAFRARKRGTLGMW